MATLDDLQNQLTYQFLDQPYWYRELRGGERVDSEIGALYAYKDEETGEIADFPSYLVEEDGRITQSRRRRATIGHVNELELAAGFN